MITIESVPGLDPPAVSAPALTRFLHQARFAVGLKGHVDVILTTDATLRRLNRDFRGKNKPTDVLSFPTPPARPPPTTTPSLPRSKSSSSTVSSTSPASTTRPTRAKWPPGRPSSAPNSVSPLL